MVSILINGACGKMGRMLTETAAGRGVSVAAGIDRYAAGAQAYYPLYERIEDCTQQADVLVDFSRPDALPGLLKFCLERNMGLVLATTGYEEEDLEAIREAAKKIPIFKTANMSLGINVLLGLVRKAAVALPEFDIEIIEKHHNAKVDAPSGTALLIADEMKAVSLTDKEYVFGRHTKTQRRRREEIGIHSVRGGTVTGEHEVDFLGDDETVTLTHTASSRKIFALGALKAAEYLVGRKPGLYDMQDVLLAQSGVTNLMTDEKQKLFTLRDLSQDQPGKIFAALAEADVNVDMISQTAPRGGRLDLSLTVAEEAAEKAAEVFESLSLVPEIEDGIAKVVIEGSGMERQTGIASGVFGALAGAGIYPRLISTSETKIGLVVAAEEMQRAASVLRARYAL